MVQHQNVNNSEVRADVNVCIQLLPLILH